MNSAQNFNTPSRDLELEIFIEPYCDIIISRSEDVNLECKIPETIHNPSTTSTSPQSDNNCIKNIIDWFSRLCKSLKP
jgi:hypothetical protein